MTFKKFAIFFALFLAIVGAISAIGWTAYNRAWVALAGVLVVVGFAVPTFVRLVREMIGL